MKFLEDTLKIDKNYKYIPFEFYMNEIINEIDDKKENILKNLKIRSFSFCYFNINTVKNMEPFKRTHYYFIYIMIILIFTTKSDKQKFKKDDLDLKYELVIYSIKFNWDYSTTNPVLKFFQQLYRKKIYNENEINSILDAIITKNICESKYNNNISSLIEFYSNERKVNTNEFELKKISDIIVNLIFDFVPVISNKNDVNESNPSIKKIKDYFHNEVDDISFKNGFLKIVDRLLSKKSDYSFLFCKSSKTDFFDSICKRYENLILNENIKFLSKFISTIEHDYFVEDIFECAQEAMKILIHSLELNQIEQKLADSFTYFEKNIPQSKFKNIFIKFLKEITDEDARFKFGANELIETIVNKKEKLAESELIKMYFNDYGKKLNSLEKSDKQTEYKIRLIYLINSL